ncbi:Acetoacetyl-CoA reductase [Aquicella siphonis]|uniref:Acetoacetyl-CoA reductase n=1 Tax=Aquicella siphonis TaxID=254247 RepID=A0A5E4PL26_9COXI|nr:acetoacetyl-CoA reductase [Aquicella siphonis]VVC76962.1 Acetoacetyl-CoA reductase [Aquicella siphonis]
MAKRIAVVTGGMGGIGHAISRELYDHGYRVVAGYSRKHEAALEWHSEQKKAGYDFDIAYADVTNFKSCEEMIAKIESGLGAVDILVNNAGITRDHACCKMSQEEWDLVILTDLSSVFYMTHAVINAMKARNYGRIINISSINGQKGQFGQVNYSAAKAGIHGFTKALALEVAKHHITVNTISPGYVATDMVMAIQDDIREKIIAQIPMGRLAEPEEVARVVSFLADERNSYITGANIAINGGQYMM